MTRFFARRYVYHMTKLMLYDLILEYAIEEEEVQPNTYYAAAVNGDGPMHVKGPFQDPI
jgi:hypothetical protein